MGEAPGAVLFSSSRWVPGGVGLRRLKPHPWCRIIGVCVGRCRVVVGCWVVSNSVSAWVGCSSEVRCVRPARRPAFSGVSWSPAGHVRCPVGAGCCQTSEATVSSVCCSPGSGVSVAGDRWSGRSWRSRLAALVLFSRACVLADCAGGDFGTRQLLGPQHKSCSRARPITGGRLFVGGVLWCGCRVVVLARSLGCGVSASCCAVKLELWPRRTAGWADDHLGAEE